MHEMNPSPWDEPQLLGLSISVRISLNKAVYFSCLLLDQFSRVKVTLVRPKEDQWRQRQEGRMKIGSPWEIIQLSNNFSAQDSITDSVRTQIQVWAMQLCCFFLYLWATTHDVKSVILLACAGHLNKIDSQWKSLENTIHGSAISKSAKQK